MRETARRLGRAPSTISRELRRKSAPQDVGGYDGDLARSRARELERPHGGRIASELGLREAMQAPSSSESRARNSSRPDWDAVVAPRRGATEVRPERGGPLGPAGGAIRRWSLCLRCVSSLVLSIL